MRKAPSGIDGEAVAKAGRTSGALCGKMRNYGVHEWMGA
jgi:hypothetical protein